MAVFIFVTGLPQPFFDQDVLLSGDAFSMQQFWVFTGRALMKLSIALTAGIYSGSAQSMGFVTYFPKGAKSKFMNKHKQRDASEHDQASTSNLISTS